MFLPTRTANRSSSLASHSRLENVARWRTGVRQRGNIVTNVTIDGRYLRISLEGMDKVWALKGDLDIPLDQIETVTVAPDELKPQGLRAPGTALPGVIYAGTWRGRSTKEFWNVRRDQSKVLVLDLTGGEYTRIAIEVDDPVALAAEINRARATLYGR